ncbi:MAG: hypothetical protein HQK56_21110 [Deltaproteobacteria bacterium]|nr:hypothetical protein [Deltaproteobacteria bacterium]
MSRKTILALVLVMGLIITAGAVWAEQGAATGTGPGYGSGRACCAGGGGGGGGWCNFGDPALGEKFLKDTEKLRADLYRKHTELNYLLAAQPIDEAKVKGVQKEINSLKAQMADKKVEYMVEARKKNPNWTPGFGQGGCGGRGPGGGY